MKAPGLLAVLLLGAAPLQGADLRIGMIGLDTSHVVAFTRLLNDSNHADHVTGGRVTAAFRGGSPDVEASRSRLEGFTQQLTEQYGVRLYDSIDALCGNVDAVMLESVDGRPHLAQAIPVILAGKPLFIDKPMAASFGDVLALFRLAEAHHVPIFSTSSLRYGDLTQAARHGAIGRVLQAETTGPCSLEPHHPDLFWYGIHGVESLFTVLGRGCVSAQRIPTADGTIEVRGVWFGGRTGVYREAKSYGGEAHGTSGQSAVGANAGYAPLLREVIKFFQTGVSPVDPEETIELFAFMTAADESRRRSGEPVALAEIYRQHGYLPAPAAALLNVRRIWDQAPHNAFTDLIRFQDRWFCVFREGQAHVSPDGAIRVLESANGTEWHSAARLTSPAADLRDPKVSLRPDGTLLLLAAAAAPTTSTVRHQTYAWTSADGRAWGEPTPVGEPNVWLWRVAWHEGRGYGVGYGTGEDRFTRLYRGEPELDFAAWVPRLFDEGYPNEAALLFRPDHSALCLLRRDGVSATAQLGRSQPPYEHWTWTDLGVGVGGPCLIELPNGSVLAGARFYDGEPHTALAALNSDTGQLRKVLRLPSGGDTSYPGLVWHDGRLWVSYYSSHEGRTAIYLAQVDVQPN